MGWGRGGPAAEFCSLGPPGVWTVLDFEVVVYVVNLRGTSVGPVTGGRVCFRSRIRLLLVCFWNTTIFRCAPGMFRQEQQSTGRLLGPGIRLILQKFAIYLANRADFDCFPGLFWIAV